MDESGGRQAMIEDSLKTCCPGFVLPNGHQMLRACLALHRFQVLASREDLAAAEFTIGSLEGIVDEGNILESPHRLCNLENDLPVTARAP